MDWSSQEVLLVIFGSLLTIIGFLIVFIIKGAKSSFERAKQTFINKIDELMSSYATMLNGELIDLREKVDKNTEDIEGHKVKIAQLHEKEGSK